MSLRQQIDELNERVKVTLCPSKIHGVGVCALRDIAKGQKLHADAIPKIYTLSYKSVQSSLFPEVMAHLLEQWANIINGSKFAYPTTRIQAWMNHSNTPNYDNKSDTLLTDVKAGDEITEDYRNIPNYQKVFPWLDT